MSNKNILNRFKIYNKLNKLISKNINDGSDKCLIHSQNKEDYLYSYNNNLFIIKQIGNRSSDASIYLTLLKTKSYIYYFITKIQLFLDFKEMLFLKKVSDYAVKYKNIHLPLFYNYLKCDKFNKFDLLLPKNININKKLNNYNYKNEYRTSYYSIFAELADGDIYKYLENTNITQKKLYNIISQCFMAIISIHNNGIYHRDTHTGNFLYHNIEPNGCIKYKYKDLIFYIENIGYNWVIWDFGRSIEITEQNKYKIYNDFNILIESLLEDIKKNTFQDELNELYNIINKYKDDYLIIKKILETNNLFSKEPIGKIITTVILK
jgi:hypothetical protein